MMRFTKMACLALGLVSGLLLPGQVSAQVYQVYYPPAPVVTYYPPPATVTYSYYPAPVYSAPVYSIPTTVYSAPTTVYSAPATVYAAPTTVYYPPTVTTTGVATTRSYLGFGIFRPFGVNQVTSFTPQGVQYNPGRVTTYYYAP